MDNLAKIQQTLLNDIYQGTQDSLPYIEDRYHNRLSVYHNNTLLTLSDLLVDMYPVTCALVGEKFFRQCARRYIKTHPQNCGNRMTYAQDFAAFLAQQPGMKKLAYVAEVADIEHAFFMASGAEDSPHLDTADLQAMDFTDPDLTFFLHPSVHIFAHHHNALKIWQAHQDTDEDARSMPDLITAPHCTLVWRAPDRHVYMRLIDGAGFALLQGCLHNQPFAMALDQAAQYTDDMAALQTQFAQFVHNGLFIKLQ